MYAILIDRNKQYKIRCGEIIRLEKNKNGYRKKIIFNTIILFSNNGNIQLGQPILNNILIEGCIKNHGRNKKIKIIKFNRRKHYKKTQGHRQHYTDISINNIIIK
ncbi:50S ribosomal protein L21 [Buchnera aphidicola (Cinara tujafilina)]|uniref:Large ribosomal subunit protein bL21 n=1 Tax=Buchnera aphidicola (Cinara tujafilina) TaxID=261317 RepID=F7WZH1_9GAMM|nr:50S ribosomal protein L21 [Buchnera aphidicola]AEH39833.1 50S ribosomal protein L21 [Buchnera aphidicola (Cinara tujafilina)]